MNALSLSKHIVCGIYSLIYLSHQSHFAHWTQFCQEIIVGCGRTVMTNGFGFIFNWNSTWTDAMIISTFHWSITYTISNALISHEKNCLIHLKRTRNMNRFAVTAQTLYSLFTFKCTNSPFELYRLFCFSMAYSAQLLVESMVGALAKVGNVW